MSNSRKSNWNRYIEGFCSWNASFDINCISQNIILHVLMIWPLSLIHIHLLKFWLFSVQFYVIFNGYIWSKVQIKISKHYLMKSAIYYEWIMKKKHTIKPSITLNMGFTYLTSYFCHIVSLVCVLGCIIWIASRSIHTFKLNYFIITLKLYEFQVENMALCYFNSEMYTNTVFVIFKYVSYFKWNVL